MKLTRITLDNFRQYHGRQTIDFAQGTDKNVTIIHGINGAGKTSLFTSINWCLYGRSVDNVKVVENIGGLISKEAIHRASIGDRIQAVVDLAFRHQGHHYTVRRSISGVKQPDGTCLVQGAESVTMQRGGLDGLTSNVPNPLGTMNAILPVNVREYFLFDGEKIDNFAKPDSSPEVRKAIDLVLKLELLDRARRHLTTAAQDYRKELNQTATGTLKELTQADLEKRSSLEASKRRIDELSQEVQIASRHIEEISQQLGEMQNAKILQQQRERIEKDLKQRQTELESSNSTIRELATGAYFVVAQPAINAALTLLESKREKGEVPSSIRQQFVQDLLDQMRCICGRSFDKNSEEYQRLYKLLETSYPGSLEDDVLETSGSLKNFKQRIERQTSDIETTMGLRSQVIQLIEDLEAELDDVGRQLRGSPLEEISSLEKKRSAYQNDIDSYHLHIGELNSISKTLAEEIISLEKQIHKAQKSETQGQLTSIKINLAQGAANAIDQIYDSFAEEKRLQIEDKTREIFKSLIWKEGHFQDIRLGKDFNLDVIDRYGMFARPELSAGERQVLSLSFITAMSRISNEEAPLVMDTPFGRLSSDHRNNITLRLPDLADQLILFVTDEELRDQARKNVQARIGAEYRLEFNTDTSCTTIKEVNQC